MGRRCLRPPEAVSPLPKRKDIPRENNLWAG